MGPPTHDDATLDTEPAGETLLDLFRSFVLLAGEIAVGSLELALRKFPVGVDTPGVEVTLWPLSLDNLEARENTPCSGSHLK